MFKFVSLVFLCVILHTTFALPNSTPKHYFGMQANSPSYLEDRYSRGSGVKTISQGRYIGGGAASIFLGFGIGQAIQGRWSERGWIHATIQSITLAVSIGSLVFTGVSLLEDANNDYFSGQSSVGFGLIIGAVIVGIGSRIWEIIDTWMLPDSVKIISQQHNFYKSSPLKNKTKLPYSVALQWQF